MTKQFAAIVFLMYFVSFIAGQNPYPPVGGATGNTKFGNIKWMSTVKEIKKNEVWQCIRNVKNLHKGYNCAIVWKAKGISDWITTIPKYDSVFDIQTERSVPAVLASEIFFQGGPAPKDDSRKTTTYYPEKFVKQDGALRKMSSETSIGFHRGDGVIPLVVKTESTVDSRSDKLVYEYKLQLFIRAKKVRVPDGISITWTSLEFEPIKTMENVMRKRTIGKKNFFILTIDEKSGEFFQKHRPLSQVKTVIRNGAVQAIDSKSGQILAQAPASVYSPMAVKKK